jgi:hypothetical protein
LSSSPSSTDLLGWLEEVMATDEIMQRHFTPAQLTALRQRWEQHSGPTPKQIDYLRRANATMS